MEAYTIIGVLATIITTVSLLPQVIKIYRSKSSKDISAGMYTVFCVGIGLWAIYGVFIQDIVIVIANTLGFIQGAAILVLKFKYKNNEKSQTKKVKA